MCNFVKYRLAELVMVERTKQYGSKEWSLSVACLTLDASHLDTCIGVGTHCSACIL